LVDNPAAVTGPDAESLEESAARRDIVGASDLAASPGDRLVRSPVDSAELARIGRDDADAVTTKVARATRAFAGWRDLPAPFAAVGAAPPGAGDQVRPLKGAGGR
jgi:hypothetical protein